MAEAAWEDDEGVSEISVEAAALLEDAAPKLLTPSDVLDMAAYMEIDTVSEIWLFPYARDAVLAELPPGWVEKLDENEDPYYVHTAKGLTTTEHPTDEHYRKKVKKARKRGPPAKRSAWMEFMDEDNRKFYYNFEKNIAKYAALDEQDEPQPQPEAAAASTALAVAGGGAERTPQPPSGKRQGGAPPSPAQQQRAGWATPEPGGPAPTSAGKSSSSSSKFSALRDLPLDDPQAEEEDDGGVWAEESDGAMNSMMMTADIGVLGEIEEIDEELLERAEALGVSPHAEGHLMWIVHDSLERLHILPKG